MSASKWLVNQQIFPGPVSITFINSNTLFVFVNLSDASISYKTVKKFHMFIQFQGLLLSGEKQHKLSGILIDLGRIKIVTRYIQKFIFHNECERLELCHD